MSEVVKILPNGSTVTVTVTGELRPEDAAFISRFLPLVAEEVLQVAEEVAEELKDESRP